VPAALVTVRQLLQRYSKCRSILDNDGGGGSVGGNVAVCVSSLPMFVRDPSLDILSVLGIWTATGSTVQKSAEVF
jgi:hypothetical protein